VKINWFSPLPPAMTEIANYTERIVPFLQEHADVVLWTDQGAWNKSIESIARVRHYDPARVPWHDLNQGDLSIFNIGNNRFFHNAIWQVSRCHPGIVILHDLSLQHFFFGVYKECLNDRDGYLEKMTLYYGQQGRDCAMMAWNGALTPNEMVEEFPLTPLALTQARGVIVHTHGAFENLSSEDLWPICYAPLPYLSSRMSTDKDRLVSTPRTWEPPYNVIMFGYIGSNRRVDAVLRALAGFEERAKFRVSIYGQLENEALLQSMIGSLNLRDLVKIHGFVQEEDLEVALSSAHLAVNLRYPTMGEASASQLRIWHHSLPSLVSRIGWYADIPDDAAGFVRPKLEIADIQKHLRAFLENPQQYRHMGARARRLLDEYHCPAAYAMTIVDFAKKVRSFHSPVTVPYLVARCAAEMAIWSKNTILETATKKLAAEIARFRSTLSVD
jgi:glycosyltransferase involved in cell wall biosynthesis